LAAESDNLTCFKHHSLIEHLNTKTDILATLSRVTNLAVPSELSAHITQLPWLSRRFNGGKIGR
jgi:hypothetical protein